MKPITAPGRVNDTRDYSNVDAFPVLYELKVHGVTLDIAPREEMLPNPNTDGEIWVHNRRTQVKTFHAKALGIRPFPPLTLELATHH